MTGRLRVSVGLGEVDTILGARLDMAVGMTWVGLALVLRLQRSYRALVLGAPIFGAAAALVLTHAQVGDVLLTHLHNVLALVLWLTLFRRRPGWTALPVALVVIGSVVFLSGAFLPWTAQHGGLAAFGGTVSRLGAGLAPGAAPHVAASVVMVFVFLQSVHYAVWTAWIPQDCLVGEGTPTFRMTMRSLLADFGPGALAAALGMAVVFAALACWHFRQTVVWYLTLVRAHAWFEVAIFTFFVGRPRVPRERPRTL